ncbi:MAG: hypothetical protein AB7T06_23435 [Kofleriaceae bacterium]
MLDEGANVLGLVADQAEQATADERAADRRLDERSFMARTTREPDGDWKTASAPAWVPSMKASVRSILPRSRRSFASAVRIFRERCGHRRADDLCGPCEPWLGDQRLDNTPLLVRELHVLLDHLRDPDAIASDHVFKNRSNYDHLPVRF